MSSYIMALVVTAEQENAIINLYRESRWVYLKIDLTQKPCDVTKWPGELIEKLQIISSGTHDSDQQSENTSQQHNTTPAIAAKTSVPSLNYGKETRDNSQLAIKHELPDDSKQGHENPYIETAVHKDSSSSAIDITPDVNIQPVKCETACLYSAEDNKQLYEEPYSETIIPKDISSSAIATTLDTNIQPVKYSNTSPTKSLKISTVMASKQNLNRQKACEGNMNQMENSRSMETTMDGARNELIPNKQQQKDIYAESSLNNAQTPSTNLHTTSKGDNIVLKSGHTHKMQCNFQCQECKKMFATKRYLTKHLKRCRLHENPFKCDRCPFSCKEEYNLHIHKLKNHNVENGRYPCLKCPRVFGLLKTLFEHLICKHRLGKVPDVPCSICGKVIFSRYLKKHEETHTETKQHKCDECPAAFRTRGGLTKHRQIHSSVKSYYCESCGKGFFTREKLKLHRRIHTGEKPYACTLCDYRCALGPNLRKHMKVHEKIS